MENYKKLQEAVSNLSADVEKIGAGNKAARTRVRVGLQEVKRLSQEIRNDIKAMD